VEVWEIAVVCALAFCAHFVGVITGGTGFVTTITMFLFGMDITNAVATTRVSVLGMDVTSLWVFARARKLSVRVALPLAVVAFVTATAAAQFLEHIPDEVLKRIVGGCMLLLVLLALLSPRAGVEKKEIRRPRLAWTFGVFTMIVATAVATVAGGGAGPLYSWILIFIFGQTYLESAGTRKIVTLGLTIGAAATFILRGLVEARVVIPLLLASSLGAYLGARFMIRRGEKVVRIIFLIGVTLCAIWLIVGLELKG
jgi:uncharacterized membrane protein YfcA